MIAQRMGVEVLAAGELVIFTLGTNFTRCLEFHVALQLGYELTSAGRAAKRAAGDASRRYRVMGNLQDAGTEKSREWTAALPERLREQDVRVYANGTQVAFKIGKHTACFDYETALTIGQWFRVRGKEARNNANEKAHWKGLVHDRS